MGNKRLVFGLTAGITLISGLIWGGVIMTDLMSRIFPNIAFWLIVLSIFFINRSLQAWQGVSHTIGWSEAICLIGIVFFGQFLVTHVLIVLLEAVLFLMVAAVVEAFVHP